MKVNEDHLYHGAALTQIAEDPQFTAINAFKAATGISRSAFRVNDDIGVFLKYATKPKPPYGEYVFTFRKEHLAELAKIRASVQKVFIALVCVKAREICCLPYAELDGLIRRRAKAKGAPEDQYTILATVPGGQRFRVYVNAPGQRKKILGNELLVPRNDFPHALFR